MPGLLDPIGEFIYERSRGASVKILLEAEQVAKAFDGVMALRDGRLMLEAGSVHALCGGNGAGKSTFLNILMGLIRRDAGRIRLNGIDVNFRNASEALTHRIAIITQELAPIEAMTVAENIYLGREPRRAGLVVDFHKMEQNAQALLTKLCFDIDPKAQMSDLSLAHAQLVEIAKAFSQDAEIVIMDEPTSAIGEKETHILFDAIRSLTQQGAGIIYVSHRLTEIFEIADKYTVFRDGSFVETGNIDDIDRAHLVRQIVGREVIQGRSTLRNIEQSSAILQVEHLSRRGKFQDISLSVSSGEVVGIYGLMGSGRTEFLECVYGLSQPTSGVVRINGKKIPRGRPQVSIRAGASMVTEDRKDSGLVMPASIAHNISLSSLDTLTTHWIIRAALENKICRSLIQQLGIRPSSPRFPVSNLSGGNQQKVVLARCLSTNPKLLICDEPTRGVDEGAKQEIYKLLIEFADNGGAVLLVSSEAPEVLQVSDRIAIFRAGRLIDWLDRLQADQETMLHAAS